MDFYVKFKLFILFLRKTCKIKKFNYYFIIHFLCYLNMTKVLTVIGIMSGTSMDAIDGVIVKTNGDDYLEVVSSHSITFSENMHNNMKILEFACAQENGNIDLCKANFDFHYKEFTNTYNLQKSECSYDQLNQELTNIHIQLIYELLDKSNLNIQSIDLIGIHGQTLYHNPSIKITIQICNVKQILEKFKIPIVHNFRSIDVETGGQGAPIAPIYHMYLAKKYNKFNSLFVNIGGISNVTFVKDNNPKNLIAFDSGPGNCLLDKLIKIKTKNLYSCDLNGKFSSNGHIDEKLLQELITNCIKIPNYLDKIYPKSLDSSNFNLPESAFDIEIENASKTLCYFTAVCIKKALNLINVNIENVVLFGGGAKNPSILNELKNLLPNVNFFTLQDLEEREEYIESELMAYIATRTYFNKESSYPNTTGVASPCVLGEILLNKII
jgi:anhydro-N-acetylmuramic acid kinase